VISGGQLNRTGIVDEPAPTDVYPNMLRYFQAPLPIYLGKTEFRTIGILPGRQICPPCVCPHSIRLKSRYEASSQTSGVWESRIENASLGIPEAAISMLSV